MSDRVHHPVQHQRSISAYKALSIPGNKLVKAIDGLEMDIYKNYPNINQIFVEVEGIKGHENNQGPD